VPGVFKFRMPLTATIATVGCAFRLFSFRGLMGLFSEELRAAFRPLR
jgi:hypothetical protein